MSRFATPYKDVLPPLSTEEKAAMQMTIAEEGVRYPVLVTEDDRVLDGHHRLEFCPDAPFRVVPGSGNWSDAECIAFVLRTNFERRNLSPDQRRDIHVRKKQVAADLRKQGMTQDRVALLLGVARTTVELWENGNNDSAVIVSAPDCRVKVPGKYHQEIADRVAAGERIEQVAADCGITPRRVRQIIAKLEADAGQLPDPAVEYAGTCSAEDLAELVTNGKKYGCIYADPPWSYSNQATRASTDNHYSTMSVDDIAALPVKDLAADYCHLHLWTTNAFLYECPKLLDAWGFEYQGVYVWCKPQMGIGNCWRVSHEFLLIAIKGDPRKFRVRDKKSWGLFDRRKHSAKPEEVRALLMETSPGPYLELFGRRLYDGWTVWGNQVQKDVISWGGPADEQ